jgi:hypothetical protein
MPNCADADVPTYQKNEAPVDAYVAPKMGDLDTLGVLRL